MIMTDAEVRAIEKRSTDQEEALALIEQKKAEYMASEEYKGMRDQGACEIAMKGLFVARRMSERGAAAAAAEFVASYGAGIPEVDYYSSIPRENARMWAASANQVELEAMIVAAIVEMENTSVSKRAIKRLAAMSFQRMDAEDRQRFKEWMANQ